MKKLLLKISYGFKVIMPYMSLIAVVLCVVNLIYIIKIQSDIENTNGRIDDVETAVYNINTDYDNSDIIGTIQESHSIIVDKIDDLEREIDDVEFEISCVKRRL